MSLISDLRRRWQRMRAERAKGEASRQRVFESLKTDEQKMSELPHYKPEEALELWKHYASWSGEDKNRMITLATSLLGGSSIILWYILTNSIDPNQIVPVVLKKPGITFWVALLSIFISLLSGYVSLLYGGYSNKNYEKADNIARNRERNDFVFVPTSDNSTTKRSRKKKLYKLAAYFSRSCTPGEALAPVFQWFFIVSILLSVIHFCFVGLSMAKLNEADFLWKADLSEAKLQSADLSNAKLRVIDLSGADLSNANLTGADLYGSNISGADFYGANLYKANLEDTKDITSTQIKSACFWEQAEFDPEFKKKLEQEPDQNVDCRRWENSNEVD